MQILIFGSRVNYWISFDQLFQWFSDKFAGHVRGMQIRIRMCRNSSVRVARCWMDLARVIKLNPQGEGRHSVEQGNTGGSPEAKYSSHPEGKYPGISEGKYPTSNQYQEFPPAYPGSQQMPGAGRLHYPSSDYPVGSIYDQPGYPNSSPNAVQDFQVGLSMQIPQLLKWGQNSGSNDQLWVWVERDSGPSKPVSIRSNGRTSWLRRL